MEADHTKRPTTGLLEHLSSTAGCMYISDLTTHMWRRDVYHALCSIRAEWYTIAEWNDAVQYITSQNIAFVDICCAKKYILHHLEDSVDAIH